MSTATLEKTTTSNGNGTAKVADLVTVHQLGINKNNLIPRSCKDCHCLHDGMRKNTLILLGETNEGKKWIICTPSSKKDVPSAIDHLQRCGINEDRNETATNAKVIERRGCGSLSELLNEVKNPDYSLEEIRDESKQLVAFYLN